jgi:H+/gluconate symporter-like permease
MKEREFNSHFLATIAFYPIPHATNLSNSTSYAWISISVPLADAHTSALSRRRLPPGLRITGACRKIAKRLWRYLRKRRREARQASVYAATYF